MSTNGPPAPRRRRLWATVWGIWLAIVAVTFAVLEAIAVAAANRATP